MSAEDDRRVGSDDIDRLVDRAIAGLGAAARGGSSFTTSVALIGAVISGLAYLVGLAAFGGSTRAVWAVVGAAILLGAVGAPLLASFRLRSLPRQSAQLAGELRTLLRRDDDAKQVIIETVSWEDDGATPPPGPGVRGLPPTIWRSQHYTTLRGIVGHTDDVTNLAAAFRRIATVPWLVIIGLLMTALSAFLGFVFLLIWIF